MKIKKITIYFYILIVSTSILSGQINTFSPYSRYGLGEIITNSNGQTNGLGDIGIGFRYNNQISYINPASYTSQDTMSFILDLGIKGKYSLFETESDKDQRLNFYFNHFAFSFPIARWIKSCIGVMPYSNTGYNILNKHYEPDSLLIQYLYKGTGGINRLFIGTSVEIFKRLSIGANFNYFFGNISNTAIIYFPERTDYLNTMTDYVDNFRGTNFNAGFQYYDKIGKNFRFTIGGIYENKAIIKVTENKKIINWLGSLNFSDGDTLENSTNDSIKISVPLKYGIGASFEFYNKFTLGIDYSVQDWTGFNFHTFNQKLNNSNSLNIGLQFIPDKNSYKSYSDHIEYRIGYFQSNSFISVNNTNIINRGITLGVGFPMIAGKTKANFAIQLGQRGDLKKGLILENYATLFMNITLHDFWFFKRKFD
jgi:hypothetical protein